MLHQKTPKNIVGFSAIKTLLFFLKTFFRNENVFGDSPDVNVLPLLLLVEVLQEERWEKKRATMTQSAGEQRAGSGRDRGRGLPGR